MSTATVSRCLNLPNQVTARTRERVMEAVARLGYSPNFGARVLAAKRTNTIGAIIPTMENAIFARGLQAFQEGLREHGATLLVASFSYQAELEAEQIRTLMARGADGLLLIGHARDAQVAEFLRLQKVPVLVAWVYDPERDTPSIGFDNRAAMTAMAREVLRLGHRRIGVISAPRAANDRARARVEGIGDAVREVGGAEVTRVIETPYGIEEGARAFADMMSGGVRPTAVMCGNDVLAVGAMKAARAAGLRVPEDVSITGFDDIELATVTDPGIATVHVPHRRMGREAADMIVRMVEGGADPGSVELATELRLRGSLGTVPG